MAATNVPKISYPSYSRSRPYNPRRVPKGSYRHYDYKKYALNAFHYGHEYRNMQYNIHSRNAILGTAPENTPWQVACPDGHQLAPYYLDIGDKCSFQLFKYRCSGSGWKHYLNKPQNPFICRICRYLLCIDCYQNQLNELRHRHRGVIRYHLNTITFPLTRKRIFRSRYHSRKSRNDHYERDDIFYPKIQQKTERLNVYPMCHMIRSPWLCEEQMSEYLDLMATLDMTKLNNYKYIQLLVKVISDIMVKYFKYGATFRKINCDKLKQKLNNDKDKYEWSVALLISLGWRLEKISIGRGKSRNILDDVLSQKLWFDHNSVQGYNWTLIQLSYHELRYMLGHNYKIFPHDAEWKNILLHDPLSFIIKHYCMENDMFIGGDVLRLIYVYSKFGDGCLCKIPGYERHRMQVYSLKYETFDYVVVQSTDHSYIYFNCSEY